MPSSEYGFPTLLDQLTCNFDFTCKHSRLLFSNSFRYSYVSVGEFVAFVIGWNMILEYMIGTSACACALSASFDSMLGGSMSASIGDAFGTIFGHPPDIIAFIITLLMTCVLACGASKSVIFNNVLNTVNLAAWVFVSAINLI